MAKMQPINKTVFVLDHTPYFGIASNNYFDFEFLKTRTPGPGFIPLSPISKSLWTSSVESCIEYCRIVLDLFPEGKLVRFVVSDSGAKILNTWSPQQQNISFIVNAMSVIGVPPRVVSGMEFSVIHGLRAAIEALSECSEEQQNLRDQGNLKINNRCRVICVTSARDDASMKSLEDIFESVLKQQNKLAAANDQLINVNHCHLVILNVYPCDMETRVSTRPIRELTNYFSSEVHSIQASKISLKLSHLILTHYDLASTTVTGIPMKEEQNASTSANYDVEIYHSTAAHTLISSGDYNQLRSTRDGFSYETTTLRWSTPRGCSGSELQPCSAQHRITPVDINSRPSSCLINFLLNGRSVMLEMPRKGGGKLSTHLLSAHGGEIFIHTLNTSRSILEDPPSISEGGGGRVTDYRIADFGLLMQQNKLVPLRKALDGENNGAGPLGKIRNRLSRQTAYWPLTISSTLVYNLRQFVDPIPQHMLKEALSEEEVIQCKQVIYNLVAMETKHEPLPLPNMGHRTKGQKREEQWKSLWNELESIVRAAGSSANHAKVLHCLLECRKGDDKVELDQALRELDNMTNAEATDSPHSPRVSVIRATTDSPLSPPHTSHRERALRKTVFGAPKSLLEMVLSAEAPQKRMEFSGRLVSGSGIARLYPNLKDDKTPRGEVTIE